MIKPFILLQYLLYMNPEIGLNMSHSTQHCFAFNSASEIKSCNRVCHSSVPIDEEVSKIKSFFDVIPFTWVVDTTDTESIKVLEKNNLNYKVSFPAMIIDLDNLDIPNQNSNIKVQEINFNEQNLSNWVNIIAEAFHLSRIELSKALNTFVTKIVPGKLKLYLGFYENKPVAAGMMILHGDIAGIHLIGTFLSLEKWDLDMS